MLFHKWSNVTWDRRFYKLEDSWNILIYLVFKDITIFWVSEYVSLLIWWKINVRRWDIMGDHWWFLEYLIQHDEKLMFIDGVSCKIADLTNWENILAQYNNVILNPRSEYPIVRLGIINIHRWNVSWILWIIGTLGCQIRLFLCYQNILRRFAI